MAAIATSPSRAAAGDIWLNAVRAMSWDWPMILGLLAALVILPQALVELVVQPSLPSLPGAWSKRLLSLVIVFVVVYPPRSIFAATLMLRMNSRLSGQARDWRTCISTGLRRAATLYVVELGSDLLVTLGLVLLVVPGVMAMLAWSVVTAVAAVEGARPLTCFRRSAVLSRGHRSAIFVFWLAFGFVAALAIIVLGLATYFSNNFGARIHGLSLQVLGIMGGAGIDLFGVAGIASLYHELRRLKEGGGADALAAVFG